MRYFVFYVCMMILAMVLGCGNQPLEILLEQSDKPTSETAAEFAACYKNLGVSEDGYSLNFDKTCIDSLISGEAVGTDVRLPEGVEHSTLAEIVSSAASKSLAFRHRYVYFSALVAADLSSGEGALTLETNRDDVTFRVRAFTNNRFMASYQSGKTYNFMMFIAAIDQKADGSHIFGDIDDPANIRNGRSIFTPYHHESILTDIDSIVSSFKKGESYFIGKRVTLFDSIGGRSDDGTRLEITVEPRGVFAVGTDSFAIYKNFDLFGDDRVIDEKYSEGSFHKFEFTIHYLSGEDIFDSDKVSIVAYFEDYDFAPYTKE